MAQRWSQRRSFLTALAVLTLAACAILASPPRDLVAKNDHAALAAWYEKEAAHLRQHAADMLVMAEEYQKSPGPSTRGVISPKIDFVQHCRTIEALYTKAADEAENLARAHRDSMK